jgi:hypothetical protein
LLCKGISAQLAQEEIALPSRSDEVQTNKARGRAEASFKKEERARDGEKAMTEYLAQGRAVREKMARLKALRLAKEAADKAREAPRKTAAK